MDQSSDRRALVVDADAATRRQICEVLAQAGYEVSACDSTDEGRRFFRAQPLVVAGGSSPDGGEPEFVDFIREEAGDDQPYIITLEDGGVGKGIPGAGVNDVLLTPVDGALLERKLEAAQHWLAGRPAQVTGNWADDSDPADEGEGDEAQVDDGEAPPLFDAETVDLANELVDQGPASEESEREAEGSDPPEGEAVVPVRLGSGLASAQDGPGQASRHHLHSMLEACPLAMAMFDGEMNYVFANAPWRRAFGLAESNLAGRGHFEIFKEVSEKWQRLCERCLGEGDEQSGEELVEWADGGRDWVRWQMRPWFSEGGVVGGLVVSGQSITGEKRMRRERRFEGDLAEAVMASPGNPVLVLDTHGRILRSNRVAKHLGRWDPAGEGETYYWEAFLRKARRREAQEEFLEFARQLLDRGEFTFPDTVVEEVVGHDGKPRRVVWTNSPRRDEEGEITGVIRIGFDLAQFSDEGRDEALRDAVLEELPVPGWRCDASGKVDLVNPAWLEMRGRTLDEELDDGWMDGLGDGDVEPLAEALREAAGARQAFSKVVRLAGADGQTRWVRFSAEPCDGSSKDRVYGVAVDVTSEHELDAAHGEAARLAETVEAEASRAARFEADLAAMAVELKRQKSEGSAAHEESERFRTIPESAPFGIVLLGRDGKTVYTNSAQAEIAGSDIGAASSIEDWLAARCPDEGDGAAAKLVEDWRSKVWRQGATAVFSLRTDAGQVRELEFRPKLMDDGGLLVTLFDVTDMRRGEEALRASEAKFRALFFDSGVAMAMADRAGEIFDANPAMESLLGNTRADLRGRRVEEFLGDGGAEGLGELLENLDAGQRVGGEMVAQLATADGEQISVHLHASRVRDGAGELLFTTYFFHDVSERLRAERGLEDSRAEQRALLGASPDLIIVLDGSGRVLELIPPVDFSLEVDREASLGQPIEEVLPELDPGVEDILTEAEFEGAATHHFRVGGERGLFHYELRAARSGESNTVLMVRDVTDVHKAQTKLKWQALTFAHIGDAIVVADMRGRVIDWNPAAERLFGYTKEQAVGIGLHEIYGADDPEAFRDEFTTAIKKDRLWEARCAIRRNDGSDGLCDAVFVTLQDDDGRPVALVGVNRDATDGQAPPVASGAGDAHAARAEMQARFDATLKTVSTLLGLQLRAGGGESVRASKARVDAIALLQSLVSEEDEFATVDFGAYAKELIGELLETEAPEETDVSVHLHAKGVVLPTSLAMPVALIANELLTNAFRYGCAGRDEAVVGLSLEIDDAGRSGTLVVKDDAHALPADFSLDSGGGLGLRIVRGLAERVGGSVELQADPETEFRVGFRLPQRG